ncbi:stress-response A/B barrel domain-containing protein UP3 [Impatiens glandulifera]|uniref:stress-response A/B barrel domain-containing protein UP3 n=1 Tax=Impatiens glandulifera TaxID=253017 RepID=UPI001FB09674|nr:stress-response A/B barrel domain-containing protein UP3 [Impatiens glandulifera]
MAIHMHNLSLPVPGIAQLRTKRDRSTALNAATGPSIVWSDCIFRLVVYSRGCLFGYNRRLSSHSVKWGLNVSQLTGKVDISVQEKKCGLVFAATDEPNSNPDSRKRKVVEHVCLLRGKENLTDVQESNMIDYLYTTQYQMGGIVAISLGRLSDKSNGDYTHAVYMRFQRKEDLARFYENSFYLRVLVEHVMPYCHGLINVDYESEVEDDMLPIFRKGEDFNNGLDFILLMEFVESARGRPVEDALLSMTKLIEESPSLIVQATQGSNINLDSREYTHALMIHFRSSEAFEIFMGSSEYKYIWSSKLQPIIQRVLSVHFSVDPVGKEIM